MHIGSIGIEGNRDKTQDTPTYLLLGIPVLPSPLYPTSNYYHYILLPIPYYTLLHPSILVWVSYSRIGIGRWYRCIEGIDGW